MLSIGNLINAIASSSNSIEGIFFNIGIIIIIATLIGFTLKVLKQPLVPGYILAGVVLGPYVFSVITDKSTIEMLLEMGITFLLFVVGLEMDVKRLKSIGLIATVGGTIQILLLGLSGWLIGIFLGLNSIEAIYCGLIVSFSSTMLVVKLLSDKAELDTLHGRIIIGILLMEDVFAIIALLIISNLSNIGSGGVATVFLLLILKLLIIVLFSLVFGKYIFPPIFGLAAKTQELLFLLSITVCFFFAFFSASIGLSISIGAFIGGLSIANLPYNHEIISKVKALLIFFTTTFFAALGMQMQFSSFGAIILPLVIFVLFISFIKPLLTSMICSFFGYKKRTSFLSGAALSQISEFSLIIVALGISTGQLPESSFLPGMAILLAMITMTMTSYVIKFDQQIYDRIKGVLGFLDKIGTGNKELDMIKLKKRYNYILVGHDRIGYTILNTLLKRHRNVLVVDFNPEVVKQLIKRKIDCIYGDVSNTETIERLNLKKAKVVICTANDIHDNLLLLKHAKSAGSKAMMLLTATRVEDALELYRHGADYVILPHFLGGHHVSVMFEQGSLEIENIVKTKLAHIKELETRKLLGHHVHKHNSH